MSIPSLGRPGPQTAVFAFRLTLLLLAAGAAAVAVALTVSGSGVRAARVADAKYVCPMHPEVRSAGPGVCPICRMELEPINAQGPDAAGSALGPSTFLVYDSLRRRGLGQDLHAPAWVDDDGVTLIATLYQDELPALTQEGRWVFSPATDPSARMEVRPTADRPEKWDPSTSRVRFRAQSGAATGASSTLQLRPGQVGWIRPSSTRIEAPVVPYSAVIESAEGPYVLVASRDGRMLAKRPVVVGRVIGGIAAVPSGLRAHERVLVRGSFFVDAERRLRRQTTIELSP